MLTLTPSSVRDYLACTWRYKLLHVDRAWPHAPRRLPALAFGASIHAALKLYHQLPVAQARLVYSDELLRQAWVQGRYETVEQEADYFEVGMSILEQYRRRMGHRGDRRAQTEVTLSQCVTLAGQQVRLRGRIDHVERRTDGALLLLDYKTSAHGQPPSQAWLAADLPTYLYYTLARRTFPQARHITVAQLYLRTMTLTDACYDADQEASHEASLTKMVQAIHGQQFIPRPGSRCVGCLVRYHCPIYTGAKGNLPCTSDTL